jgi:hypothetical protein
MHVRVRESTWRPGRPRDIPRSVTYYFGTDSVDVRSGPATAGQEARHHAHRVA